MSGLIKVKELSRAVVELREVCLHSSSRWAAELLRGLPHSDMYREAQIEGARSALQNAEEDVDFILARQMFEARVSWVFGICIPVLIVTCRVLDGTRSSKGSRFDS